MRLSHFSIIISIIAIAMSAYALSELRQPEVAQDENAIENDVEHSSNDLPKPELAVLMGHNLRYVEKLYYAGQNANWPLADFYHHELEEIAEEIVDARIKEDGLDISDFTERMYVPALDKMKTALDSEDVELFGRSYASLVSTCNACHVATNHKFIRILEPEAPSTTNQDFLPAD